MDKTSNRGRRDIRARKDLKPSKRQSRIGVRTSSRVDGERLKKAIEDYTRMMNALCA